MFEADSLKALASALETLSSGFDDLPDHTPALATELEPVLQDLAERLHDNYPYAHPLYAGQMLKPPHPVARAAYALTMYLNPNNHALDGGRASSALEKEAVARLAAMFGWSSHLGHLCGGGTLANMEALWVAARESGGKLTLASEQAHYTHGRISQVLGIPFQSVAADASGRMDVSALARLAAEHVVGTVVVTLGTTACGAIDPLDQVLELQQQHGFRIHIDAAYGGYYRLASNLSERGRRAFELTDQADSIVIDPHKHGLQPYGCGCVLFRDPSVGRHYKHDSPYTYFSSDDLHLGEISLECSRAGAAAAALWATQNALPMVPGAEFARSLESCREAALKLYRLVQQSERDMPLFEPELDIVIWAPRAARASQISALSQQAFYRCAEQNLHLALVSLPKELLQAHWPDLEFDTDQVSCLRSCLMKPEHLDWVDRIWAIYQQVRDTT